MIIGTHELHDLRQRHQDSTIALRFGCYDLLHAGHQRGVDYAADQADILVVGVMPDRYVRTTKGPQRPINNEHKRVAAINEAPGVDYSVIAPYGRIALAGFFLKLRPDVYVEDIEHGGSRSRQIFLRSIGTVLDVDHQPHDFSTTRMLAQMGVREALEKSSLKFMPQ